MSLDLGAVADVSTAAGVIVAIVFGIRSDRATRRAIRLEAIQAEASASRTEAAARLTEEYTLRVVDALESISKSGRSARCLPRTVCGGL